MKVNNTQHQILDPIQIVVNNSYNVTEWEKALIIQCMKDNPTSNTTEVAKLLGMAERTLYRKLIEYGLESNFSKNKTNS